MLTPVRATPQHRNDASTGRSEIEATAAIESAEDSAALEKLRVEWLGKKGRVTDLLKSLGQLDADERPKVGAEINAVKQLLNEQIGERKETLQQAAIAAQLAAESLDVTLPGRREDLGALHPITRTIDRMAAYFAALGFEVVEGPEIEDDYHNFEALNIPAHHPARAMHDTFYIDDTHVLRTHTSGAGAHHGNTGAPAQGDLPRQGLSLRFRFDPLAYVSSGGGIVDR